MTPTTQGERALAVARGDSPLRAPAPVFPCDPATKVPFTPRGFKDATTDPETIERWWDRHPDAAIGMPTGAASGFSVLDVDTKGDVNGYEGLARLEAQHGPLDTLTASTPSGGEHRFVRDPKGEVRNTVSKLAPGVDSRGDGGYVILSDGSRRCWGNDVDVVPAPGWLHGTAGETSSAPSSALESASAGTGRPGGLADLLAAPPQGDGSGRNNWLTRVAGHYARHLPFRDAYEASVRAAAGLLDPRLPEEEIAKLLPSIWNAEQRKHAQDQAEEAGWLPLPLGELVEGIQAGEVVGPQPALLRREDGTALLYPGELHSLSGEPETGKGWLALHAARQELERGAAVLYLDFEDTAASVVGRLLALGADPAAVVERFVYVQPTGPLGRGDVDALLDLHAYTLAVIDGLTEAYALLGLGGQSRPDDIPVFMQRLPRPLASRGAAVLQIDHVPKDGENRGRYAIGGQHKLAGVAAAFGTKVTERWTREHAGKVELRLHKDRHGTIPGGHGEVVAVATVEPHDGELSITLRAPDPAEAKQPLRPTALMEKVSRFLEREPGASQTAVERAVRGKRDYMRRALAYLVEEGYVSRREGGQAYHHYSERPYRQADDPAADVNAPMPLFDGRPPPPFDDDVPTPTPHQEKD
jgi:hypothetical protein